jgi:hypothetical protein
VKRESNVVDLIPPAPDGFNISREAWFATSPVMRDEIIRLDREMSEGLAIAKDRRAGRGKRAPGKPPPGKRTMGGWYELLMCERDGSPAKLARAAELREALAPEAERMALNDDLAEYHALAESKGTTLTAALGRYIAVEQRLRADPYVEILRIAEAAGIDIEAWARKQLADPEAA